MIELKDICKSFGDHVVLKNFSLKINKNEFIAIIGESGAGKTTILNMISMIDKPDSGSISINGENSFSKKDIQNLRRYVFGYIFQNYALIENDTVKENLLLSKKYRKNFKEKELEESLEKVGISKEYLGHKVCELSGGEQQRIAIARTMLKPCEIILADEPTGNLDSKNSHELLSLFRDLNINDGVSILMVTHDAFTASYAHRILFIKDGKIFNELVRGEDTRKDFFNKIIDVVTILGGDSKDVF